MSHMQRLISVVGLISLAAACGFEEPPPAEPVIPDFPAIEEPAPEPPPPPPTAMERLHRGLSVDLMPSSSAISIAVSNNGAKANEHVVSADRGRMGLRLSLGDLHSTGLEVQIDDIEISPQEFPPSGVHLRDIRATMEFEKLETVWLDGQTGSFHGPARLHVTWSLVRGDGVILPVRPIDVDNVPIDGEVIVTSDDRIELTLRGIAGGVLLDVAGLAQLSDLTVELMLMEPTQLPTPRR